MDESDAGGARPTDPVGRVLYRIAETVAVFGGLVLVALTAITVWSIIGRQIAGSDMLRGIPPFSWAGPVTGDFELVEIGCAVAVFAFLPYCQIVGGNVLVDFFTSRAGPRTKAFLATVADAVFTLIAAMLAWRMVLGAEDLYRYRETTMVLRMPVWWGYVPAVAAMVLLTAVCAYTTWRRGMETLGRAKFRP